jgi:hypothetical protein
MRGGFGSFLDDGGRYHAGQDGWSAVYSIGAPSARSGHPAIWTGSEMIIWGGFNGSYLNDTFTYHPPPHDVSLSTTLTHGIARSQ